LADQTATDRISLKLKEAIGKVAPKYPELHFYLTGAPILQEETIATLKHDELLFVPLVALFMLILLFISFRSWRGVVLPFLATGAATIWALGWLVLVGHPLDIVNNKLIVLLLVIGISCAVQVFSRFQEELLAARKKHREEGKSVDHDDVVARTVQALVLPCLLTTATAAIGFGAVVVSQIGIIRHFGIDAALGVMVSYVTTMLFVPALLRILPLPKDKQIVKTKPWHRFSIDGFLSFIARFSMRFRIYIISVCALVTLAGVWIGKDIQEDQRLSGELPAEAPSVRALGFIEKHLTGIMSFDIVFEGRAARLDTPDVIRAAAKLEEFAAGQSLKPTLRSFSDLLLSFERSLFPLKVLDPVSTWSDEKISQMLLLFDMADPALIGEAKQDFRSKDGRFYRIQGLLKDANTQALIEFRRSLEAHIKAHPIPGVQIHLTGAAMISAEALSYTISSMLWSLGVAILAIFLLVLVLLRSFRFAFIALFPNLVPIVTTVAAMQIFGISLRVATVMTFSMALGIAVDACIYLITRFREEAILHHVHPEAGKDHMLNQIIERTMRGSGRPIVYTTLMLLAGFSALGISRFAALRDFAILSSITLSTALFVDLLLWPALVLTIKPRLNFVKAKRL
jgi:predicted RND superfamily exporter protein